MSSSIVKGAPPYEFKSKGWLPESSFMDPGSYGFIAMDYGNMAGLYVCGGDGLPVLVKLNREMATDLGAALIAFGETR